MSKLPHYEQATIPKEKILHYLLSEMHAVGKSKAKFFHRVGYNETNYETLIEGLKMIVTTEDVVESIASPYGTKYVIDGTLFTPNRRQVHIQTVWIIETESNQPRFVTAYPN